MHKHEESTHRLSWQSVAVVVAVTIMLIMLCNHNEQFTFVSTIVSVKFRR